MVRLPNADHRKVVLVHAVDVSRLIASYVYGGAWIQPSGPCFSIALIDSHLVVLQSERGYPTPFWALKRGRAVQYLTGLVYKSADGQRLPAVGVGNRRVARIRDYELIIERLIVQVLVIKDLVGAILNAKCNDLLARCSCPKQQGSRSHNW